MIEIRETAPFARWLAKLADPRARAKVLVRIQRLALGNPGDVRPVGEGVSEMRIDYGSGYRIYVLGTGPGPVVLLAGGDKQTQANDIARAQRLARAVRGAR